MPIVYELDKIKVRYAMEMIQNDGEYKTSDLKNHYIYIISGNKKIKYTILINDYQEDIYKAFVIYINALVKDIDVNRLKDDLLLETIIKDSIK